MASKNSKYERTTDYQLPPGELWWLLKFKGKVYTDNRVFFETVSILFTDLKTQTWFQANAFGELLVREFFDYKLSMALPQYKVTLWEPPSEYNPY